MIQDIALNSVVQVDRFAVLRHRSYLPQSSPHTHLARDMATLATTRHPHPFPSSCIGGPSCQIASGSVFASSSFSLPSFPHSFLQTHVGPQDMVNRCRRTLISALLRRRALRSGCHQVDSYFDSHPPADGSFFSHPISRPIHRRKIAIATAIVVLSIRYEG